MPSSKAKTKKPKNVHSTAKKSRTKKQRQYKTLRLTKRIKSPPNKRLPYSWSILKQSLGLIKKHWKHFVGILLIYLALMVLLRGNISSDFASVKESLEGLLGEEVGSTGVVIGLYAYAIASSGSESGGAAGAYQLFITLIISLATIWSVRQFMADESISLRDSFYRSMYPAIPFILIIFVIGLQLLPALAGSFLLSTALENAIAVTALEKFLWVVVFALLLLLSLYMVCSSIFALYISTLPDMTPMKALRSARGLVLHRRLSVAMRLVGLTIFLILLSMLIIIPLIIFVSWSVVWAVLVLGGFSLMFFHIYLYKLYRQLL